MDRENVEGAEIMKQQATHSEILLIASLVLRINELNIGHILTIDIHQSGLSPDDVRLR
jgi:hypothetical protein